MTRTLMTDAEIAQAKQLYAEGHSTQAIAAVLGRSSHTIYRRLVTAGVRMRKPGRPERTSRKAAKPAP